MLYKPYGNTGKMVSAVSCGGMRFADPKDMDLSASVVYRAYEKGVNYFDTAPFYCGDQSEEIFGKAISQMDREKIYVSTKCMASDGDELRQSLERSLERLGVDKINFFHIWCLVRPEQWPQRKAGGAVAAAQKAKEEGLIEHLVFSSHMSGDKIGEIIDEGVFEGVTLGYCAINFPFRQVAVDKSAQAGLGVITMNPLAGGIIPSNPDKFDFLRSESDHDVVAAAIRFNVSQPGITSALVGFSNNDQVDQAIAAVENFEPYDAAHIEGLKGKISDTFDGLCTGCGYCLPCPQGLEVPKFMDAYNQKMLDSDDAMLGRFRWHWNLDPQDAAKCTSCGACEKRCTQQLAISDRMAEIATVAANKAKEN